MVFRVISNVENINMVISIEVFLGFGGIGVFGGLVEVGVYEGVEDIVCNFVLVVCWVVFGIVFGR